MLKMCPICRSYHSPDVGCSDKTGSYLGEIGIKRKKVSTEEEKKVTKKANLAFLVILLCVAVIFAIFIFINR